MPPFPLPSSTPLPQWQVLVKFLRPTSPAQASLRARPRLHARPGTAPLPGALEGAIELCRRSIRTRDASRSRAVGRKLAASHAQVSRTGHNCAKPREGPRGVMGPAEGEPCLVSPCRGQLAPCMPHESMTSSWPEVGASCPVPRRSCRCSVPGDPLRCVSQAGNAEWVLVLCYLAAFERICLCAGDDSSNPAKGG